MRYVNQNPNDFSLPEGWEGPPDCVEIDAEEYSTEWENDEATKIDGEDLV